MKLFKIITMYFLFLYISIVANAQIKVDVNIGTAPVWGPAITNEDYYFLPEIETYYDLRTSQYIYFNNNRWVRINSLPKRYQNYDLNNAQVIILGDYHGRKPFVNFNNHKVRYMKKNKNWKHTNGNSYKNVNYGNGKNKNKGKGKNK